MAFVIWRSRGLLGVAVAAGERVSTVHPCSRCHELSFARHLTDGPTGPRIGKVFECASCGKTCWTGADMADALDGDAGTARSDAPTAFVVAAWDIEELPASDDEVEIDFDAIDDRVRQEMGAEWWAQYGEASCHGAMILFGEISTDTPFPQAGQA